MSIRGSFPEINQLSIVAAAILLAFALTQLVSFPAQETTFSAFGILVTFGLDFSTIITILTATLAAAGMEWLIQSHPNKNQDSRWFSIGHWILPIMTTLVIGVALNNFAGGGFWWVIFGFGSLLLLAVLVAEFNVVNVAEERHPLATVGLTGLSFALYLLLAISIDSDNLRLYLRLPLLGGAALMVISRAFYLRLDKWALDWALVASLIVLEIAIGLNYIPVTPIQFGLILVGTIYALTSLITGIKESRRSWAFWAEPVGMLVIMILVSLFWF